MADTIQITGKNTITFGVGYRWQLYGNARPRGMSDPLSSQAVEQRIRELPVELKGHIRQRGLSIITFPFNIHGSTGTDMQDALHKLIETLEDGALYIATRGARGTKAQLVYKKDGASATSYKTLFCGEYDEGGARDVLGREQMQNKLIGAGLTLYCEAYWRPEEAVTLGPNEIYCPSFEEDGDANGRADDWDARAASVLTMESTIVLHGCYSQQVDTNAANEGIESTAVAAPAAPANDAVAYAWVCRPAAGSDIRAILRDTTAGADRATALYSAATTTATGKSGETWYRLELTATNTIIPANNHELWIESTAATVTTFYVDKCFLKFDTTVIPDEWCDHWLLYNHYDTTEGVAHEGHQNYFDVADLKGTVESRLRIDVNYEQAADLDHYSDLIIARRSWWDETHKTNPVRDVHWLEAEDNTDRSNWLSAGGVARCSSGDCVTNAGAATTGFIEIGSQVHPSGAGFYESDAWLGRWDVFGIVFTDDVDNTMYRLYYGFGGTAWFYNQWVRQTVADCWQIIHLGEIDFEHYFPESAWQGAIFYIAIEYQKQALDTASLDCLWLLPKAEPRMRLCYPDDIWMGAAAHRFVSDQTKDFEYQNEEFDSGGYTYSGRVLQRHGENMTCPTNRDVRFYLSVESIDTAAAPDEREWEAHGTVTDLQWEINILYLPQFISPLE